MRNRVEVLEKKRVFLFQMEHTFVFPTEQTILQVKSAEVFQNFCVQKQPEIDRFKWIRVQSQQ